MARKTRAGRAAGMPAGQHGPYTPVGEIGQFGTFASGAAADASGMARKTWLDRRRRRRSGAGLAAGMPAGQPGPYSPVGEIGQSGRFASGVSRQIGWRRVAGLLLLLVLILPTIVAIIALVARHL
jgi:hypothetical protein